MDKYLFCLIILVPLSGVYMYSLEIEDYSQSKAITRCKEGLIANVDNYTITARITAKLNTLQSRALLTFLSNIQNETFDSTLCQIYFSKTCRNVKATIGCYCQRDYNGTFQIMLNKKAELEESEGHIFLKWPTFKSSRQLETRTVQLPVIHQQEHQSLYVGNRQVWVGTNCTAYFDPGDVLRWCVKNLLRHTLTISFDYSQFNSSDDCVQHEITKDQATSQHLTISYEEHEGCQRRKVYTCNWRAIYRPKSYGLSIASCGLNGAMIFYYTTKMRGRRILEYLGFTPDGVIRGSLAAKYKRFVRKWNIGLTLMSVLQKAGQKRGELDSATCAFLAVVGAFVGIGFGLVMTIILFLCY